MELLHALGVRRRACRILATCRSLVVLGELVVAFIDAVAAEIEVWSLCFGRHVIGGGVSELGPTIVGFQGSRATVQHVVLELEWLESLLAEGWRLVRVLQDAR